MPTRNIWLSITFHTTDFYIRSSDAYDSLNHYDSLQGMPNNASPTNANDEPMIKYDYKLIIMPLLGVFITAVGDLR